MTCFKLRDDWALRLTVPTASDDRSGKVSTTATMQSAMVCLMSDSE